MHEGRNALWSSVAAALAMGTLLVAWLASLPPDPPPVRARELAAPFLGYLDALCQRELELAESGVEPERGRRLRRAWAASAIEREGLRRAFARGGALRPAAPDVRDLLARLVAQGSTAPCFEAALLDVLDLWPEVEPEGFVADLAAGSDHGFVRRRARAVQRACR